MQSNVIHTPAPQYTDRRGRNMLTGAVIHASAPRNNATSAGHHETGADSYTHKFADGVHGLKIYRIGMYENPTVDRLLEMKSVSFAHFAAVVLGLMNAKYANHANGIGRNWRRPCSSNGSLPRIKSGIFRGTVPSVMSSS